MQIEREVIISILRTSKTAPVSHELVKVQAKLPLTTTRRLLQTLHDEGLIYLCDGFVQTNTLQRLGLAVRALELGTDYEEVGRLLDWKEFEKVAGISLEALHYTVKTNVRFNQRGRKWEMDIIGCLKPLAVCIDCKHWRRGPHVSKLKKAAEEQVKRTIALCDCLPNPKMEVECAAWEETMFVPVIVSLVSANLKFHDGTPIVPILQLHDFLAQLPMRLDSVRTFNKRQPHFKTES